MFYSNFEILWNLMKFLKVLKFFENFEMFWKFLNFMKFSNILISKKQFLCNNKPYCTLVPRNFIHWFCTRVQYVYVIWMWIDWYRKYQPAEPEYEVCWRVSEANESQTSYSVDQADIFSINHIHIQMTYLSSLNQP